MPSLQIPLINEIKKRILRAVRPDRIILFGSAATGQMSPDSDIDLLILESNPADCRKEGISLRNRLRGLGYAFDVIVMPSHYYEANKHLIGSIAYPAEKYGQVIYHA